MLVESLDKSMFKDDLVANAIEALLLLEQRFVDLNQANTLAGHLVSLSSTFRNENTAILHVLSSGAQTAKKSARPVVKMKSKIRQPFKKPHEYDRDGNCTTCGQSTVSPKSALEGLMPAEQEHELQGAPETLEKLKAKTWREVLNTFDSDPDVMKVFMTLNDINVGQTTAPAALAKKIFKKLRDEGLTQ